MQHLSRSLSVLGASLLLGALCFDAACTCDGPPRIEGCRDPLTDFSGITDASLVRASVVRGPQGGEHFQYEISATGTGLGTCVGYRSELLDASGAVTATLEGGVRADVVGETLTSSPIIHLSGYSGATTVRVTTLGRTLTAPVHAAADAGALPDAPAADAP